MPKDSIRLSNYTYEEKNILIRKIKEKVNKDEFVLIPREKNQFFLRLYRLNRTKVKNILSQLAPDDFSYKTPDEKYSDYGNGMLIVFKKKIVLENINGIIKEVIVYIKCKEIDCGEIIPIISFHENE